jgi:hypothetical protein
LNALTLGIGSWRYDLSRMLMEYKFPTEGGEQTAVDALHAKGDPAVLESPLGLVRDAQMTPSSQSAQGSGEAGDP